MNFTEIKKVLQNMASLSSSENKLIVVETLDNSSRFICNYANLESDDFVWMIKNKFITVFRTETTLNLSYTSYTTTCYGILIDQFYQLKYAYDNNIESLFNRMGKSIVNTINIDPTITTHLQKLLLDEEQEALKQYYRDNAITLLYEKNATPSLSTMFDMSTSLGKINSNNYRTTDYVIKKCIEELGELALEDNINKGLSYKSAGSDGVAGEAVDLAICAMDMFALQFPDKTAKEIEILFLEYMTKKIDKWKSTLDKKAEEIDELFIDYIARKNKE